MALDKITKLGRYFLALPMVVFGIQHFLYAEFIVYLVPTWVPGGLFWTYFAGVALFGAALIVAPWVSLLAVATLYLLAIPVGLASYARVKRRRASVRSRA